jgi:nitrous oxidase accessory protein NosD
MPLTRAKRLAGFLIVLSLGFSAATARAAGLVVGGNGPDCAGAAYASIGAAVAAAVNGDQITICSGVYAEQVVVTKNVTLLASGTPIIRPTSLPESRPSTIGGRPITAGILVDAPRVVIDGLEVDMSAVQLGTCSTILAGIYLRNASGVVHATHVSGTRVAGLPDCESGVGLFIESGLIGQRFGVPIFGNAKVNIRDDRFDGNQKGAVVANGVRTSVKMLGGDAAGDGAVGGTAQNGVQIGLGAKAKLSALNVHGFASTTAGKTGIGVLIYKAARTLLRGSKIMDSQTGVFSVGSAFIQGNEITNLVDDGIVLFGDSNHLYINKIDGAGTSGIFVDGDRNLIHGGFIGHTPVGLWFYAGQNNNFGGVLFDPTVPLHGQGVYGGTRNLSAASSDPLLPGCVTAADCDDGNACTTDTCDATTGACVHTAAVCTTSTTTPPATSTTTTPTTTSTTTT